MPAAVWAGHTPLLVSRRPASPSQPGPFATCDGDSRAPFCTALSMRDQRAAVARKPGKRLGPFVRATRPWLSALNLRPAWTDWISLGALIGRFRALDFAGESSSLCRARRTADETNRDAQAFQTKHRYARRALGHLDRHARPAAPISGQSRAAGPAPWPGNCRSVNSAASSLQPGASCASLPAPRSARSPEALADVIRRHRIRKGLSQEALAEAAGFIIRTSAFWNAASAGRPWK